MGSTVELEDVVVEVLDAQAESGDADFLDGFELVLLQRARLALERDLTGLVP